MNIADYWTVIQAEGRGVTGTRPDGTKHDARKLSDVAPGGWYRLIRPPRGVEASRTLAFARREVGTHYGFFTIASIAIDIVTPVWMRFPFRKNGTWICSALGAEALRYGGFYHRWPDIYQPTPSAVMNALLLAGGVEVEPEEAQPGDAGFAHSRGFVGAAIRFAERKTPDRLVNHMFVLDRLRAP